MRTLYHATEMSNLTSILEKGLELRNMEKLVYLCEKPEDCLKFAMVHGVQGEVLVVAVQVADEDIIETFDHSTTFFQCRCFGSTKPIVSESIIKYIKYTFYEKTDEFKAAQEETARKASELAKEIEAAKKFPFEIAEGMETEYADYVKLNSTDGYSRGVVVYGELWAQLMQMEMAAGKTLEECADETSHKADTDGITGFMYGAAVNALSKFWKHGEALRVWHNKQHNHEGAGVVNPAIITIKMED